MHASTQHSSGMSRPARPCGRTGEAAGDAHHRSAQVIRQALVEGTTLRHDVVRSSLLIVHHSQPHGRAERSDSGQICELTLISPHHPLPTLGDFGVFPAPMRAACAQVWLVLTSVRPLRTLERATAAWRGGGEAQEAACGGSKSRDSCDSDAFARPRARRALTGLRGLDVRPCPTPPGSSAGNVAGRCAALVVVC